MKDAVITIKLNKKIKEEFQKFCDDVGLNPSVAINMYINHVVNNQELPFSIKSPNKETIEALEESEDMLKHPEKYKSYSSVDDMFKDLNIK